MTDAGTTQDYFILPAPPVGGVPITQDWLDRMKLVHDRTVPIILPSEKDILASSYSEEVFVILYSIFPAEAKLGSALHQVLTNSIHR